MEFRGYAHARKIILKAYRMMAQKIRGLHGHIREESAQMYLIQYSVYKNTQYKED